MTNTKETRVREWGPDRIFASIYMKTNSVCRLAGEPTQINLNLETDVEISYVRESAYLAVCKESEANYKAAEQWKEQALELQQNVYDADLDLKEAKNISDQLRAERERHLRGSIDVIVENEIHQLHTQLAEAKRKLGEQQRELADAMSGACDLPNAKRLRWAENRIERLEAQLASRETLERLK